MTGARRHSDDDVVAREYDVFLSYARADLDAATRVVDILRRHGYAVWWDRELLAGEQWPEALAIKIKRSRKVIVLWSPASAVSQEVYHEAAIAELDDDGNPTLKLVPFVLVTGTQVPQRFVRTTWVHLTDIEAQEDQILGALEMKPRRRPEPEIPAQSADRVRISALPTGTGRLVGRMTELDRLHTAWLSTAPKADARKKTNVAVLHAIGGAGKTALMRRFVDELAAEGFYGAHKVYGWSAYSQGSGDNRNVSSDGFIHEALAFFGHDIAAEPIRDPVERARTLARLVRARRCLFVLDGLEPLQYPAHISGGRLKDHAVATLIKELAADNAGLLLITSRQPLPELAAIEAPRVRAHELNRLTPPEGVLLLEHLGAHGRRGDLAAAVDEVAGHALSLTLLGTWLNAIHGGDITAREQLSLADIIDELADFIGDQTKRHARRAAQIMEGTVARLEALSEDEAETPASPNAGAPPGPSVELMVLGIVGLFDRPASKAAIDVLLAAPAIPCLTEALHAVPATRRAARLKVAVARLRGLKLLNAVDAHAPDDWDAHPLVREYFGKRLKDSAPEAFRAAHSRLYDYYRYLGLPAEFQTPEAHGLFALVVTFPKIANEVWAAIETRQWPRDWQRGLPPSLIRPEWLKLDAIADLRGTPTLANAFRRFLPATMADMAPLSAAIAHGCAADRANEALLEVYVPRVRQGSDSFIADTLGALNDELTMIAQFFATPWLEPSKSISSESRVILIGFAAFALKSLGRLREALMTMQVAFDGSVQASRWVNAGSSASGVADILLPLGEVAAAVDMAAQAVSHADTGGDLGGRIFVRSMHADALHHAGRNSRSSVLFEQAESLQEERQPELPKLYAIQGHRYCNLLLARGSAAMAAERARYALRGYEAHGQNWLLDIALDTLTLGRAAHALWRQASGLSPHSGVILGLGPRTHRAAGSIAEAEHTVAAATTSPDAGVPGDMGPRQLACGSAGDDTDGDNRAAGGVPAPAPHPSLSPHAPDGATGRGDDAARTEARPVRDDGWNGGDASDAVDEGADWKDEATRHLDDAVAGLRKAGQEVFLPAGLLARAAFRRDTGDFTGAAKDLEEAAEIAERCEMRLFEIDALLESARLTLACLDGLAEAERDGFRRNAEAALSAAQTLIEYTGYKRRIPEVLALRRALDGDIPATLLGPDLDPDGLPAGLWIEKHLPQV